MRGRRGGDERRRNAAHAAAAIVGRERRHVDDRRPRVRAAQRRSGAAGGLRIGGGARVLALRGRGLADVADAGGLVVLQRIEARRAALVLGARVAFAAVQEIGVLRDLRDAHAHAAPFAERRLARRRRCAAALHERIRNADAAAAVRARVELTGDRRRDLVLRDAASGAALRRARALRILVRILGRERHGRTAGARSVIALGRGVGGRLRLAGERAAFDVRGAARADEKRCYADACDHDELSLKRSSAPVPATRLQESDQARATDVVRRAHAICGHVRVVGDVGEQTLEPLGSRAVRRGAPVIQAG